LTGKTSVVKQHFPKALKFSFESDSFILFQGLSESGKESEWGSEAPYHTKALGRKEASTEQVLCSVLQGGAAPATVQVL